MARTITLVFDEYPDDEVVLRVSPVPVSTYFDATDQFTKARFRRADFTALAETIAPYIERWTFDVPQTAEGLADLDVNLVTALVAQWLKGVRDVPLPLPVPSSAGETSE